MARFCGGCGREAASNQAFCEACGRQLPIAGDFHAGAREAGGHELTTAASERSRSPMTSSSHREISAWPRFLAVLIVLAAVGGLWLWWGGSADEGSRVTDADVAPTFVAPPTTDRSPVGLDPDVAVSMIQNAMEQNEDHWLAAIGPAEVRPGPILDDLSLCVAVTLTNVGARDQSVSLTLNSWSLVRPSGTVTVGMSDPLDGPLLVTQLVPTASVEGTLCFSTLGETGSFRLRYAPTYDPAQEWSFDV